MNTLNEQLAEYQAAFRLRVTPDRVAVAEAAITQLKGTGIEASALGVGATLPDLTLPDANGRPVGLRALSAETPLVIVFYRGGWCPYCNLELREWQRLLPEVRRAGATLVAISPQSPDNSLSTQAKNELAFPVLSDSALAAAEAFGIAFVLPPELVDAYSRSGNDLPILNGNGRWVLPLPATYVIGGDGVVIFAHVEADYRRRAEPSEVLAILQRQL